MARKKKKNISVADTTGSFQANPFKQLKGFAASAPPKEAPEKRSKPPADAFSANEDDRVLFAEEMRRLGLSGDGEENGRDTGVASAQESRNDLLAGSESDRALFLDALKGMETVFEDSFPLEEEAQASPRRMKLLRQGRLSPEAQLDLHGLTREEARTKVGHFLEDSVYQGKKTVLIVTGRGKGSEGEPVLRGEIERYLATGAGAWVSEWGRAPRRYGGEGALVVFLKKTG